MFMLSSPAGMGWLLMRFQSLSVHFGQSGAKMDWRKLVLNCFMRYMLRPNKSNSIESFMDFSSSTQCWWMLSANCGLRFMMSTTA